MYNFDLQDLFLKLSKYSDDKWKLSCTFEDWSPVYTTEEICRIIDRAFYEYKLNPNKDINWLLETIKIISNHAIIEHNDFSSLSKEEIIEGIISLSKSYDEMQFIRHYESDRFLNEYETLYAKDIENGLTENGLEYFDSLRVDKSTKFFWFIGENLNNLTKSQNAIYSIIKHNRIASIVDVLNLIVMKLHIIKKYEGEQKMNDLFNFNGMFGRIEAGMCRLTMNGNIAVKTSNGYKSYNIKTGRLTNCSNFCFNIGEEFFFVIPTNKVEVGDIILVNRKPKCVIKAEKNQITVINYEDSTVDTILPERHVFMGNTYFYGKIVSMFGNNITGKKNGANNIMRYMMMSEMMKSMNGGNGSSQNGFASMLPFMMMGGKMENMFDGMFNFNSDDEDDSDEVIDDSEATEEEEK